MAGHTKGPWEARRYPEGDCWHIHFGDKGGWLGEVYIDGGDAGAASDARLIAAAPDLLEALIEAAETLERCRYSEQAMAQKCRVVIAKATQP